MKLIRKVETIEVKRTFVMTEMLRKYGVAGKRDWKIPSREKYIQAHSKALKAVRELNEKQLDKMLHNKGRRLVSYNNADWYMGEVSANEVAPWIRAGGLPFAWTKENLTLAGRMVKKGLETKDKMLRMRARRVIPVITALASVIKKEKYSLPIVEAREISSVSRKGANKKYRWHIDDGNMRAISYAVMGDKKIRAYIGIAKPIQKKKARR